MANGVLFLPVLIPSDICDAKNGDRNAAEKILKWACQYLRRNEPFPPALRDYYLGAFNSIIKGKMNSEQALCLKRTKKGKRPDMENTSRDIAIAKAVQDGVNQGLSVPKAINRVLDDCNVQVDFEQIKRIYRKWRAAINQKIDG